MVHAHFGWLHSHVTNSNSAKYQRLEIDWLNESISCAYLLGVNMIVHVDRRGMQHQQPRGDVHMEFTTCTNEIIISIHS